MAVTLKKGFTLNSFENLKSIASQALGHGIGEGSNGGRGYMGIMKNADGTLSAFKCLTHSKEYKEFEKNEEHDYEKELRVASDNLKTMLMRLGREADVNMEELEHILNTYTNSKENYLSRKMVASAVTMIAKCAVEGGDAKSFWKEVTFAGSVHNTNLVHKTSQDGASIEFASTADQSNISALTKVKAMNTVSNELPTTIEELENRLYTGELGEEMIEVLNVAMLKISDNCPSVRECFSGDMDYNWLYDNHENEFYAHKTLAEPQKTPELWNNVRINLFKLSLDTALENLKKTLEESKRTTIESKDISALFQRAYVRSGYAYAGLKTACDIAEKRSLKCRFENRLSNPNYAGIIFRKTTEIIDQEFDSIKIDGNSPSTAAAKSYLAGNFGDHEANDNDKWVIRNEASKVVNFIYSGVKRIEDLENSEFVDDKGTKDAMLTDKSYVFNPYSSKDERNGEEIVNALYKIY